MYSTKIFQNLWHMLKQQVNQWLYKYSIIILSFIIKSLTIKIAMKYIRVGTNTNFKKNSDKYKYKNI